MFLLILGATTAKAETKVTKIVASTEPDTTSQTTKQTTTNATTAQTKATTTTPKPSTTTILSTTTTTTSFTTAATTKTPIATEVPKASTHVPQTTYENISTLQNADKTNSESSSSDKVTMQGRTYVTHMPSEDLKRADGVVANKGNSSGMGTVGIVFIVLGLVVVAVASAIVVKVWYKRRVDKRLDYRASLHSTNPLYDEIENQEKELTD
ncbi:hypothetical protein DPMN_007878 [Dreissena polymorpha]|uniref:Uncharacterized protein n=1 Tax=Dreissena polymorpha TaxID=45954 RepID=A0A9D4MV34_DREPO|nr:hypothetical protein DPMN_007878 [Dreissena polymorpha]